MYLLKIDLRNTSVLTRVSASRKTHLENCVNLQQCSLVKVTPRSGRVNKAKFTLSRLSRPFTTVTTSKTSDSCCLKMDGYLIKIIHRSSHRPPNCFRLVSVNTYKIDLKIYQTMSPCHNDTYLTPWVTPIVIIIASLRVVPTFLKECARTSAPTAYVSLVANVTKASSSTTITRN